jgi:hypothetical protein
VSDFLKMMSTADLEALGSGDLAKVSTQGLQVLQREQMRSEMGLDPSKGGSTVLAGIGSGMASGLRALGAGGLVGKMGLPATQAEAKEIDAPLDATTGGKVGRGLGLAALAAPTALIPGANTYAGATLLGGLAGGALTEGGLGDRAQGAAFGAAGGAAGKFAGDMVGKGANALMGSRATDRAAAQAANAQRDAAAVTAREAGYVIPPADVRQSAINEALNGMSGKIKTAQVASQRNQGVTNSLARRELGIADDVPLNAQTLNAVRNEAGKAYQAVEGVGTITPGESYTKALDKIVEPYIRSAKSFPNSKPNPIVDEISALKTAVFDAGDAVAKIRTLRADADAAYGQGNKELGKSLKAGADALEQAIDDHLAGFGPSKLLADYRDARKLIAKTYSVQKGLNEATGDVSAAALAKQLEKGKVLSGELEKIAKVAQAFPKATQSLKEAPKSISPLDLGVAAISGTTTGNPAALAMMGARPAMRSLQLSSPFQNRMLTNNYGPTAVDSLGLPLLTSDILRRSLLPLSVGASVPGNQ